MTQTLPKNCYFNLKQTVVRDAFYASSSFYEMLLLMLQAMKKILEILSVISPLYFGSFVSVC